jgi:hypothetical protein
VSYGDYLEQLTYLIFIKMADEYSQPPFNRNLGIPADYSWDKLAPLADLDALPDPDVLAGEIIDNLETAMESFREIMTELG